jgi:hypothetical protein
VLAGCEAEQRFEDLMDRLHGKVGRGMPESLVYHSCLHVYMINNHVYVYFHVSVIILWANRLHHAAPD